MIIEQHECLEEEGTKELIALTKAALNTKLNSNDVNISDGTITIKGRSITPVAEQYSLPIASDQTLGGIKVGTNLSIDPITGVLSATGGGSITVDDHIDGTSENPVQNKVIKSALDDKLDKTEATIASGVITIQEHQLVPMTTSEVETMWGSIVPPQPSSGLNVSSMITPANNINTLNIAEIGSQTIIGT